MQASVIIPSLNEAQYIEQTIRRILEAGGDFIAEILVVDGGSTDNTIPLARKAGAKVIQSDRGRALQMNEGARQARAEILYFVHADSLPPTSFASEIKSAIQKGWRMGNFRYHFDSPGLLLRLNAYFTRFHAMVCQGGDKTFFIEKNLFWELGAYDPYYCVMEEYDFLRRAKAKGHSFVVLRGACTVSARKYENNSWLRVQLANFIVFNGWAWGLSSPKTLKKIYKSLLQ